MKTLMTLIAFTLINNYAHAIDDVAVLTAMKFNDHKTITWLIYEIGYLNDAILRGDIILFKNAKKLADKKLEQAKKDLAKDGITDSFFMVSDFGGRIALSYEYKYPDGFAITCKRVIPTGDIK